MKFFKINNNKKIKPLFGAIFFYCSNKYGVLFFSFFFFLFSFIGCKKNTSAQYSFFVAGHTYGSPDGDNIGLYPPFLKIFKKINKNIAFGFLTGDVIRFSDRDIYWETAMKDIDSLNCEIHVAPGNHDIFSKKNYEKYFGKYYYAFEKNGDLFIVLNGNENNWNIEGEQLYFLNKTIKESKKKIKHIFIFIHQLIWWQEDSIYNVCAPNSLMGKADVLTFHEQLLPFLKSIPKPVFLFAGDVGVFKDKPSLFHHVEGNVTMIASGMGNEKTDNFLLVNVLDNGQVDVEVAGLNCQKGYDCLGNIEDY